MALITALFPDTLLIGLHSEFGVPTTTGLTPKLTAAEPHATVYELVGSPDILTVFPLVPKPEKDTAERPAVSVYVVVPEFVATTILLPFLSSIEVGRDAPDWVNPARWSNGP